MEDADHIDDWFWAAYLTSESVFIIIRPIRVAVTPNACLVIAGQIMGCMP